MSNSRVKMCSFLQYEGLMWICFFLRYKVSSILLDIISISLAFLFYVHFLPSVEIETKERYHQIAQQRMANSQSLKFKKKMKMKFRKKLGKMSSKLQRLLVPSHHSWPNRVHTVGNKQGESMSQSIFWSISAEQSRMNNTEGLNSIFPPYGSSIWWIRGIRHRETQGDY